MTTDALAGAYTTPLGAIADNKTDKIDPPSDALRVVMAGWIEESQKCALQFAYAVPVALDSKQPAMLTRDYQTTGRAVAEAQVAVAGYQLANLLNEAFKCCATNRLLRRDQSARLGRHSQKLAHYRSIEENHSRTIL